MISHRYLSCPLIGTQLDVLVLQWVKLVLMAWKSEKSFLAAASFTDVFIALGCQPVPGQSGRMQSLMAFCATTLLRTAGIV